MNKVQPQNTDAEKAVLGACLLEREAFQAASEILRPEMFYIQKHSDVFNAMERLSSKSQPIDLTTVAGEFRGDREMPWLLSSLTNSVVSSAHLVHHARMIVETYLLRQIGKIGATMFSESYKQSADPFAVIEQAEKELHELTLSLNSKDVIKIDDTLVSIVRELEEKRHRKTHLTGVSTGFRDLDKSTCGWQPTDLVILAARPKCGKTAFALNLALNAAMAGNGVAFFSMEMSASQLVKRILSNKAEIYLQTIRDARLDDEQMNHLFTRGVQKVAGIPFYIDDTAALSVAEFKGKARRMVKKYGVKMLVVDYLQLMQADKNKRNQNREQEVSGNARQLKIAAKELDVPIICLSQLNRDADGKVPQLSNLRESGAIEQDADMVCFLYKPDDQQPQRINFKIAAYRNGELKEIEYDFKGEYQRFEEVGIGSPILSGNWKPVREEDSFPGF